MAKNYFISYNFLIHAVSGKWKPSIICALGLKERRYGELKRYFDDLYRVHVSEKVLTEELNQLINDQLVKRTGYPVVPPKVVYSLTADGLRMKKSLSKWRNLAKSSSLLGKLRMFPLKMVLPR